MLRRRIFLATLGMIVVVAAMVFNASIHEARGSEPTELEEQALNLPESFEQLTRDRVTVDSFPEKHYRISGGTGPVPKASVTVRNPSGRGVRVIQPAFLPEAIEARAHLTNRFVPARSFRAPILDLADECCDVGAAREITDAKDREAAEHVRLRLASEGLIRTLRGVIRILGPESFRQPEAGADRLDQIGFPVDLLEHFEVAQSRPVAGGAETLIRFVAGAVAQGGELDFEAIRFRFMKSDPKFRVATESGEHEIAMLRLQAGGGYDRGIVPGGSLDVISQLVAAFPEVDFMISIPNEMLPPFHSYARTAWRLRRADQITIVGEPLSVTPWVQDNGKAGWIESGGEKPAQLATLAPRYASVDEGISTFVPGDSFLMEGLKAAGHAVVHSPLLFQGGNLLVAQDPKTGERILLIGEGELYRNMALGLSRDQAIEAFRIEFAVDRCLVLPAVSYHLDYDVCVRAHHGGLIAFINDPMAAVRIILELGVAALERQGALQNAAMARTELKQKQDAALVARLRRALVPFEKNENGLREALAGFFVTGKSDLASGNLQTFLLALDLLESTLAGGHIEGASAERAEYLRALQRIETARLRQVEALKQTGWRLVAVPSLPDLGRGINYVNGIHHRTGYIMPAFGGFYAPLDQAAAAEFSRVLGPDVKITQIQSAESQRLFGGVHCTAAAYPRL